MIAGVSARRGTHAPPCRSVVSATHRKLNPLGPVNVDGNALKAQATQKEFERATPGWFYASDKNILCIKVPDEGWSATARIE